MQCVLCEIGTWCLNIIYTTSIPINEMGEACGMCVREEWCMQRYGGENSGEKRQLERFMCRWWKILKCVEALFY